ncbi:MAG: hypothetical protein RL769_618 [Pseudomonadota bacterium]|jgi:hypothetical protein
MTHKIIKKTYFKIMIIAILLPLFSCRVFYEGPPSDWGWGFRPKPLTGMRNFPSAKTEYGKGFRDGCQSALNAVAKGLAADLWKGKYDYVRSKKSPDYNTGWFDGLEQCTYIIDHDVL